PCACPPPAPRRRRQIRRPCSPRAPGGDRPRPGAPRSDDSLLPERLEVVAREAQLRPIDLVVVLADARRAPADPAPGGGKPGEGSGVGDGRWALRTPRGRPEPPRRKRPPGAST